MAAPARAHHWPARSLLHELTQLPHQTRELFPRELFLQACPRFYSIFFPESPPPGMVVSMAKIFHEARFNRYLTNKLARFVAGIHACRREAFASLSKRGPLNPLRVALERVVLPDQSD